MPRLTHTSYLQARPLSLSGLKRIRPQSYECFMDRLQDACRCFYQNARKAMRNAWPGVYACAKETKGKYVDVLSAGLLLESSSRL